MADALTGLSDLFTLTFVVTSMASMGLSLTIAQVAQPLRNVKLVLLALAANFVVVPVVGVVLGRVLPITQDMQIGLLLLATAAGAPFLPKLAHIAKADVALAVGLMTLLVVATVIYLPLVLPLLLPGVQVDAASIALTLVVVILLPLVLGLLVKARWDEVAQGLVHPLTQISNISLALLLVLMLGLNIQKVLGLFGSGAILAMLILIAAALAGGYLLGGSSTETRRVVALGTGQRNMAAGFTVAGSNFADQPDVLVFLAAAGLISVLIVMPVAAEFGRRSRTATTVAPPAPAATPPLAAA